MSLESVVRHYRKFFRPNAQAELKWFVRQPTLEKAIEFAALATDQQGRRFSHQRRLTRNNMERAHKALMLRASELRGSTNFAKLYRSVVEIVRPLTGLGELYWYDTALRIGAALGKFPAAVYLHAGTRVGAAALGCDPKVRSLMMGELPEDLRSLEPHEIEDVLCIYKKVLATAAKSDAFGLPDEACYLDDPEDA